jgi:hypothetical protein
MVVARKAKKRWFPRVVPLAIIIAVFLAFSWSVVFPDEQISLSANGETSSLIHLTVPPPNTKGDELNDLVEARISGIAKTDRIPGSFPPLSSLIVASASTQDNLSRQLQEPPKVSLQVVGDVQFLLDYAIVGFSKCGTTTLLKWIRRDPDVRTFKREIHEIIHDNPGRLVERLYQNILENPVNITTAAVTPDNALARHNPKSFLQGFKNPEILQVPNALRHIDTYWPETKLVVSVRNPLKWFRSFYNFRLTIGHLKQVGKDPNALIGHCDDGNKMLCSHMGAFHVKLFRLGKTDMSTPEEFDLLRPFLAPDHVGSDLDIWDQINRPDSTSAIPRMKNKIFFLDLRQLSDSNRTRAKIFRRDLQFFLGLRHELSPVFRARPFKQLELTLDEESKRHKIQSICDPQYLALQQELYPMAQKASLWIRNFFLKSEDVVVSSPEYVEELLESWMHNPCDTSSRATSN